MTMQRNYFSVLFFIKRTKLLKNGNAPICLRITVNGKRAEIQIKRSVDPQRWDSAKECAIGRDGVSMELNHYLNITRNRIMQIHSDLEQAEEPINADIIKRRFYGDGDAPMMLCDFFREQNKKYRELIGIDYVIGTVLRYERTERYLGEFIKAKFGSEDLPLKSINNQFIHDFEHFLKVEKRCAQNAAVKYLKNLKRITRLALANKLMRDDPFVEVKFRQTKTNRDFLTERELNLIMTKEFSVHRLEVVRDIFCFCALTGLAFTDVQHLRREHITQDADGEYWIRKPREKTNNMCSIPLLNRAQQILDKYKDYPERELKGMLLPIPSNQRFNSYLKEIADLCGINKLICSHVARHSFACLALANKVSMESIAKMLGHTDLRTTKIYAKLMDETLSSEMKSLKDKFAVNL
ncbi:MAG: site-specific integrase [Rikenellaceae bacterium]